MAEENKTQHEETQEAKTPVDRLRELYENNASIVSYVSLGVVLLILGLVYLFAFHMPKREVQAHNKLIPATYYFEKDSFQQVLDNDVESIASSYGRTKAGNLARYYAGVSYYHLGNFDQAVKHLRKFKTNDPVVGPVSQSILGDALAEKGDMAAALKAYDKAVSKATNEAITPTLLLKAGMAYQSQGNAEKALAYFERLQLEYPNSTSAIEAKKYEGQAKAAR